MIFDCRTHDVRLLLAEIYEIKPIIYTVVLDGQEKYGCCDNIPLRGKYFSFEYKSILNPSDFGVFFVGEHCGFDFIEILKSKNLNSFDPVFFDPYSRNINNSIGKSNNNLLSTDKFFKMTPLNKEVFIAINLICISWNKVSYGNLSAIINFCSTSKIDTQNWVIDFINKIIGKDALGRNLIKIYQELQDKYGIRRDYSFENLVSIINKNNWQNNIQ
jgi:hypothetical protein